MTDTALTPDFARQARLAGLLYLIIIVTGLGAELGLRAPLINLGDAEATAAAILGSPGQFRLAIGADIVMALSDAGLAILLYLIFRTMAPGLALSAMVFRLIQTVLIAASLMALLSAWLVLTRAEGLADAPTLALVFLDLHVLGYDLGLVFFGVNSLIIGRIVSARVAADAERVHEAGEQAQVSRSPILAYVHPGRFATIEKTLTFPFPAGMKK